MISLPKLLSLAVALPTLCLAASSVAPLSSNAQTSPTNVQTAPRTTFPDVPQNFWARPFIERLAQRNILAGYPDGTFRPQQTMQRDELAAVIRRAFNEQQVRQIESGSAYRDVPQGYWAERPIEVASEEGFMSGDGTGNFRPNQPVTKVEVIRALNRGLGLPSPTATTTTSTTTATAPAQQRTTRRTARRPVFVPIAITSLMQSIMLPRAEAAPGNATPPRTTTEQAAKPDSSASDIVNQYYTDADSIPENAVSDVAAATKQNIVVNYPNRRVLNPNQAATRAEISALVHQTLVSQGRMEPLAGNSPVNQYVVRANPENQNNQ